ncbi:MAG: glycosyltransferase, partial [Lewinella sp.]|nr:glycosyltransferase [Lewinella sp.]
PLFITFGSMINAAPAEKTRLILNILERHRIPAILNTASGGLVEPTDYDRQLIHFVPRIPYDWILPKVHGVVHHGGSGTTHLALKYGCASLIIPHIIDQFVWNSLVHELGAGPKGIKINRLTGSRLEPLLLDLYQNPAFKARAEEIGAQMKQEKLAGILYEELVRV